MNQIPAQQNEERFIRLLSAQRFAYNKAKKVFILRLFASLVFATLGPLIIINFETIAVYVAIAGIFYTLIDVVVLRNWENNYRLEGAKIQETFDIELFGLQWNDVCCGRRPDPEIISSYSSQYTQKHSTGNLHDWYPEAISTLEQNLATLVCQRTNTWWDTTLRNRMSWFVGVVLTILTAAVFFYFSHNSELLFAVLFALAPLYEILIDYIRAQVSSARTVNELKIELEHRIESAAEGTAPSPQVLRSIQDTLFRHRSTCLFVPDWFYFLFRNRQEEQMNHAAEHYVNTLTN